MFCEIVLVTSPPLVVVISTAICSRYNNICMISLQQQAVNSLGSSEDEIDFHGRRKSESEDEMEETEENEDDNGY